MGKVFVVTQGDYSDYKIVGVFSSRLKAEEICPAVKDESCGARIEEYELDVNVEAKGEELLQHVHRVYLVASDGSVPFNLEYRHPNAEMVPRNYSLSEKNPYYDLVVGESVESYEHAHKLAVEARQAFLRERGSI